MKNICISLLILGLTQAAIAVDDIPASVTSVEAEDLESSGTTDVKDLAAVTPDAVEKGVQNESAWYLTLDGGLVAPTDSDVKYKGSGGSGSAELSYDNSYLIEGALGYTFSEAHRGCVAFPTRLELGISYYMYDWDKWREGGISFDESKNSTSYWNFMFNGYWDFNNRSRFTPFLIGGLGFTRAEIDHQNNDYDDTVFAGQAGAGVSFELSEKIVLNATYRYHISGDIEFKDNVDTTEIENQQHHLIVGARIQFN